VWRGERGVALVLALMAVLLLSCLAAAMVLAASAETLVARHFSLGIEARHAAEAAVQRAIVDLAQSPDLDAILTGVVRGSFIDGGPGGTRTLDDGSQVDLDAVRHRANCARDTACSPSDLLGNPAGDRPWGANNPVWQLYEYGFARNLTESIQSPFYLVVLAGDDPEEVDGDPGRDAGETGPGARLLLLRSEAIGPRGVHALVEATILLRSTGPGPPGARAVSWRWLR
jgi:hypothetical protein